MCVTRHYAVLSEGGILWHSGTLILIFHNCFISAVLASLKLMSYIAFFYPNEDANCDNSRLTCDFMSLVIKIVCIYC